MNYLMTHGLSSSPYYPLNQPNHGAHVLGRTSYDHHRFNPLTLTASLTGQWQLWMAVIFMCSDVQPERKKHPDITGDNSRGRSRGGFGNKTNPRFSVGIRQRAVQIR